MPNTKGNEATTICTIFIPNPYPLNKTGIYKPPSVVFTPSIVGVVFTPVFASYFTSFKFAKTPTSNTNCIKLSGNMNSTRGVILSDIVRAPNNPEVHALNPSTYSIPDMCLLYLLYKVIKKKDSNRTEKDNKVNTKIYASVSEIIKENRIIKITYFSEIVSKANGLSDTYLDFLSIYLSK